MTEIEQGSAEWFNLRCGKVTASQVARCTMGATQATIKKYKAELCKEILTNTPMEMFQSDWMERGKVVEPQAVAAYEFMTGQDCHTVSFVQHPFIERAGASPDRLVGKKGIVEFKCPSTSVHMDFILGRPMPKNYRKQCFWQLACCPDRDWVDFASFDPDLPPRLQLHKERIERDHVAKEIHVMEEEVEDFIKQVERQIEVIEEVMARQ